MMLQLLGQEFSICRLDSDDVGDIGSEFLFHCRTDKETSVVCPSSDVPADRVTVKDDGWRAFRVTGTLDLSMIGVLSGITGILAEEGIPVFAVSTFDTDYILIRKEKVSDAVRALSDAGYGWVPPAERCPEGDHSANNPPRKCSSSL
ncbi:MAG: ACT domain-containing protein [Candidatus Methanomethylophilaceae archaeon]